MKYHYPIDYLVYLRMQFGITLRDLDAMFEIDDGGKIFIFFEECIVRGYSPKRYDKCYLFGDIPEQFKN